MVFVAAILTVSDTASVDATLDKSGPLLRELLEQENDSSGSTFKVSHTQIVPDERDEISGVVRKWASLDEVDWIITSGGTGFGRRDCTPEAVSPLLDRAAPGIVHLILNSSIQVTPLASLSRPVAGTIGSTLVVTLPGSPKAVKENISALLSSGVITHALDLIKGGSGSAVHKALLGLPNRLKVLGLSIGHGGSVMVLAYQCTCVQGAEYQTSNVSQQQHLHSSHQHQHQHQHHHPHHHHDHRHGHTAPVPKSHDPSHGASARHRSSPYPLLEMNDASSIVQKECSPLGVITKTVGPSLSGHILAENIKAPHDLPLSATTNVDGYAVNSSIKPGTYQVLTPQTFALSSGKPIPDDFIYRINTGSPLPAGTDAVVMVEDTELFRTIPASVSNHAVEEEAEVKLLVGVKPGECVRHPGSDVKKDDMVLEQGTLLTSLGGEIGTLAFVGVTSVKVYRKPVVAVMSTGNEIVDLLRQRDHSDELGRDGWGGTFDTNRPSLTAALQGMGYEVIDCGIVSDDIEAHTKTIADGLSRADILITTGGSSMGSSDLLKPVIERYLGGTVHFGRVAIKPGKPTTFATIPSSSLPATPGENTSISAKKPVFALPGNPASALVMFYVFVVPALRKLGGWDERSCSLPRVSVQIMDNMPLDPRPEFHRVHIRASSTGLKAYSTGGQRSSRVASLAGANGLVALPARAKNGEGKQDLQKGESADALVIGEIQPDFI